MTNKSIKVTCKDGTYYEITGTGDVWTLKAKDINGRIYETSILKKYAKRY